MIKKFLAFLGLLEITLKDGMANVQLTEAQMEASGKIISDLEAAEAKISELETQITAAANLATENSELKAEIAILRKTPGAATAVAVKETDGNTDVDPCMIDLGTGSIVEQLEKLTQALNRK